MPSTFEWIAYRAAQRLRVSWYFGQKWLSARLTDAVPAPPELKERMPDRARILTDLRALLDQDWRNIEQGLYHLPEGVVADPLAALRKAGRYFADLRQVDARRRADANDEVFRSTPPGRYPRYYLQNFHYQTDGWLSRRSAELYDHQVEVLFGGGADAMRRQALVPLQRELARRGVRRARLLDIGCGTGRFLREVKSNYPRLDVSALDLSPFYLAEARRNLAPWSRVEFIAAAAEDIPSADASFDVISATYLFHELPAAPRRRIAAEIARLLTPGGLLIFLDSLQHGDEPDYDALLDRFPHGFHEPYYASYVRTDLAALFGKAGLAAESADLAYFSKLMTFRKR